MTKSEPQHLGRNDHPVVEKNEIIDSTLFPGMKSVKVEKVDRFDTRPGRTLYEGK